MEFEPQSIGEALAYTSRRIDILISNIDELLGHLRNSAEAEKIDQDLWGIFPLWNGLRYPEQQTNELFVEGYIELCRAASCVKPVEFGGRIGPSWHSTIFDLASCLCIESLCAMQPARAKAGSILGELTAEEQTRMVQKHRGDLLSWADRTPKFNAKEAQAWLKMELVAALKSMPPDAPKLKAPMAAEARPFTGIDGQRVTVGEPPAEFREGGKPDGEPLCFPYLADNDWYFTSPYISKKFAKGVLTKRHPIGNKHAYLFTELAALRRNKSEEEAEND